MCRSICTHPHQTLMIKIPHSRPLFGKQFEDAASHVIQSGFLAQGQESKQLEQLIQNQLQQRFVLAVDSGTSALMLAIRILIQHKKNARVGIPAYACASLLFAVKATGAQPVFMDCNKELCLDKEQAEKIVNTLDLLVLVHPFGMVEPLVLEDFPCPVIEDIAQSVGSTIQGKEVGTFADISIGSLYATKPWGGAYGGFVTSRYAATITRIAQMCDPDKADITSAYAGHHQLSDLHASVAIQRINNSAQELIKRELLATQYDEALKKSPARALKTQHGTTNYFRYIIYCETQAKLAINKFQAMGIDANRPVQQPLHHSNADSKCPVAFDAWQHCISLPMLTDMSDIEFAHMQYGIQQCL